MDDDCVGEYHHFTVVRPDGLCAPGADAVLVAAPRDGDPLDVAWGVARSVFDPGDSGVVLTRRRADERGAVSLGLPVARPVFVFAWDGRFANAGPVLAASIITRPLNVWGDDFHLLPAVALRGDVADAGGRPAAGATVRAELRATSDGRRLVLTTACDRDGAFAFPPLPVGAGEWDDIVALRADATDGASVRCELTSADLRAGPVRLTVVR